MSAGDKAGTSHTLRLDGETTRDAPEWVPKGVIRAADEWGGWDASGIAMIGRLVCNDKMQSVWNQVFSSKQRIDEKALTELPEKYRCLDENGLCLKERAAASLFLIGLEEMTDNVVWSAEQLRHDIYLYDKVIEKCRFFRHAKFIDPIEARLRGQTPALDHDLSSALKKTADFFERLKDAHLSIGGVRWNHQRRGTERQTTQSNAKLNEPRLAQVSRARIAAMIDITDRIFIPPLRKPLATIADITLLCNVTAKDIENIRRNIKGHQGPKF